MSDGLVIRPRRQEDDPEILAIYNEYADPFLLTLESLRYHVDGRVRPHGAKPISVVAELDGKVGGDAFLDPHNSTAVRGVYFLDIQVDRPLWRRGIGSALWENLQLVIAELQIQKLYTRIKEGMDEGEAFARVCGFEPTGRVDRLSQLVLSEVNLEGYQGLEEKMAGAGITVTTASRVDTGDDEFMRDLYEVVSKASADIPRSEEYEQLSFEKWRPDFLRGPDASPDAYWIAIQDSRPIGMACLFHSAPNSAGNGLTGVHPQHRGKGVARLLKLHSIRWAQQQRIERITTSNDAENERMLSINVALGYKPLPGRREWLKELLVVGRGE